MDNKERLMSLIKSVDRDGWLENTDFFEAPASTKYHLSEEGGLLQHSLNVYDELNRLLNAYPNIASSVTEQNIIVSTLLHDICKVNFYKKEKRNRKNDHASYIIHTKLNFPEFDFHSLRHTHATLLVENGAPPMYVQHRLGHKNLNVTMKYYLHFLIQLMSKENLS